jgi:hypothetical protein
MPLSGIWAVYDQFVAMVVRASCAMDRLLVPNAVCLCEKAHSTGSLCIGSCNILSFDCFDGAECFHFPGLGLLTLERWELDLGILIYGIV